jgi:hypothetical protein
MLHYKTVSTELLELLKFCMTRKEFSELRLVGGTDLALQYGHRKSVDIDLFGIIDLEKVDTFQLLNEFSKDVQIISKQKHINIYIVNGVKIDFVNYNYPWLKEPKVIDNICLAAVEDVAAMKLNAIAGRGSKKDFIDIELILKEFSLNQLVDFYKTKYNQESEFMALKSMLYFADADLEVEPEMFSDFKWTNTKQFIKQQVEDYLKN